MYNRIIIIMRWAAKKSCSTTTRQVSRSSHNDSHKLCHAIIMTLARTCFPCPSQLWSRQMMLRQNNYYVNEWRELVAISQHYHWWCQQGFLIFLFFIWHYCLQYNFDKDVELTTLIWCIFNTTTTTTTTKSHFSIAGSIL